VARWLAVRKHDITASTVLPRMNKKRRPTQRGTHRPAPRGVTTRRYERGIEIDVQRKPKNDKIAITITISPTM